MYIVIVTSARGVSYYGPFPSITEASEYAESRRAYGSFSRVETLAPSDATIRRIAY